MCSYCGCRTFTVVARLTEEHERIVNSVGDVCRHVQRGEDDAAAAEVAHLVALLDEHTRFEEHGLFAELRGDDVLEAHTDLLREEHHEIDRLAALLGDGDLGCATRLEHLLRRHIDREENGLFPAAAIALDGAAWDRADEAG